MPKHTQSTRKKICDAEQFFCAGGAHLKQLVLAAIFVAAVLTTGTAQAVMMAPNQITTKSAPLAMFEHGLVQRVHSRSYRHRHHNNNPGVGNGHKKPGSTAWRKQCSIIWKRRKAYRGKMQLPWWYGEKCVSQYGFPTIAQGNPMPPQIPRRCKRFWERHAIAQTQKTFRMLQKCVRIFANRP